MQRLLTFSVHTRMLTRCLVILALATTLLVVQIQTQTQAQTQAQPNELPQDPIRLAIVGPMLGTSFTIGIQLSVGVTAALNTLTDGSLLGRTIQISTHDDRCTRLIAEKLAQDLVKNPPDVIIGHSCSAATIAAAPIYAEHGVLQITPASTHPRATEMGINTIFRMIGRDDVQARMAAERLSTQHAGQKIGIFYFPSEYSTGLAEAAMAELAQRDIQPSRVVQGISSATSYIDDIQTLMEAGIEVVYLIGGGLDNGVFMRQARQMGAAFAVIATDTLVSAIFRETAGQMAEEVPFTFSTEAAGLPSSEPAIAAIRAMGEEPVGYTLLAYAATEVWIEGVKRAGNLVADNIAAAIRSQAITTILGPVSFDTKGDIQTTYPEFSWFIWQDGKRVPLD
ncbi:MAG: branched-chain amino acid ABC transporter substrate-binding protein [Pseudomonadales bacterium]|nr:branched-chain amino acid ABC transporter substrate-binding protein [Pseudomonadales bacterium]